MKWVEMREVELQNFFESKKIPKYRGTQIFEGFHGQRKNLSAIQNVPDRIKNLLDECPESLRIEEVFESKVDSTKKLLYRLADNEMVEGVLMEYKHGYSLCISTQVGCKMGCKFCVSTIKGKLRDLSAYEMLLQVYQVEKHFSISISNIILMGSGEPLDNYHNVLRFLHLLHEKKGKNMSYRNMTLSTCGLVPEILDLAHENIPINLALSLHETKQEKREELMPIGKKYSLREIFSALKYFQQKTSKRITLEYTLIEGENDFEANIEDLKFLTKNLTVLVNLIPLNATDHFKGSRPNKKNMYIFCKKLNAIGIPATIRRELGSDIQASCGQLKAGYENGIKGVYG